MGEGVKAAAKLLSDAGVQTVDCKIYEGMRHEVLNEIGKEAVWEDIRDYILDMADGNCEKEDPADFRVFADMQ